MSKKPIKPNNVYLIYMDTVNVVLNDVLWLTCHKTKPKFIYFIYV